MNIMPLPLRHIARAQEFDVSFISDVFALADTLGPHHARKMSGLILASLFYEESTRTRFSFETAMLRLGGHVIGTENAKLFSSVAKGESLHDTIRVVGHYADIIVLRHDDANVLDTALSAARVPVINGGCGSDQHPTQALLDLHAIRARLGRTEDLAVALAGDLLYGRTVHSLAYLLGKYRGNRLTFVSPKELRMPQGIKDYLERHDVESEEVGSLDEVVAKVDVLYQTRVQKNRFADEAEYERLKGALCLSRPLAQRMRDGAIIMHPLPRTLELPTEVDVLPQAIYLDDQIESGVAIRKALLMTVAGRT